MKVIQNNVPVDLSEHIRNAEKQLKNNPVYIVESLDYIDHIAAYLAWLNVGGNIFVKSKLLPKEQSTILDNKIKDYSYKNSICFHTSGTTGEPKLVVHTKKQIEQFIIMATNNMHWEANTKFLNYVPPATSGFWHIVLAPSAHYNSTLVLGSKEKLADGFNQDVNLVIVIPTMLDIIRINKLPVDFSKFNNVLCGGSVVLKRHAETVFNLNGKIFNHAYGATEFGSPILHRESKSMDEYVEYLNLEDINDIKFKIVNDELYVTGPSLCENYKDFSYENEWLKTNDLWDRTDNLIKFKGRSNDIVKINGYQCSLLLIERIAEENTKLGETLAVRRNTMGIDWVELLYTNKTAAIDKKELHDLYEPVVPACNIPKKFTHIDTLPKNILGKKIRHVL